MNLKRKQKLKKKKTNQKRPPQKNPKKHSQQIVYQRLDTFQMKLVQD